MMPLPIHTLRENRHHTATPDLASIMTMRHVSEITRLLNTCIFRSKYEEELWWLFGAMTLHYDSGAYNRYS